MASNTVEALIGGIVLAAAGGFLVYAANTAEITGGGGGYQLIAKFRKAEGLSPGGDVRISGVKVGSVSSMVLDPNSYRAVVTLSINQNVKIPEESAALITSSSLLGDNYIAIQPGGSDFMLEPGSEIEITQDSVNLMDLVGKFIHGSDE
ncbi:outer membrane lipid asymmetry maintenance protein MlaD [Rhodobacteraceae bacterium NNCM2]|nr:outer membrane lipid asymmetry maintenance protein MlaD [Coraliihabitans acroporae]